MASTSHNLFKGNIKANNVEHNHSMPYTNIK